MIWPTRLKLTSSVLLILIHNLPSLIFVEYNPIVGLIIWICEGGTASLFEAKGDVAEPPNT